MLWQLASSQRAHLGLVTFANVPAPSDVVPAAWQLLQSPKLVLHLGNSLYRVFAGFGAAAAAGIVLGMAIGRSRWLEDLLLPPLEVLRPIPGVAWIPLAIIWLGIGPGARMSVVFVAALVPWVMNSMQAVVSIDPVLIQAARTLGASDRVVLSRVVARTALPTLIAGARIALGNAWTTLIAAELLAASSGLGYVALNASRTLDTDILLVAMATIGVLGALLSLMMQVAARVLAPWSRREAA